MSISKMTLAVLQRISEFLADLPDDLVADLADGRARLAYVPAGATEPAPAKRTATRAPRKEYDPPEQTKELLRDLEIVDSREAAAQQVAGMNKTRLKEAARALSVPGCSSMDLEQLRQEVVEATAGRRIDSIATRGFEGTLT